MLDVFHVCKKISIGDPVSANLTFSNAIFTRPGIVTAVDPDGELTYYVEGFGFSTWFSDKPGSNTWIELTSETEEHADLRKRLAS